MVLSDCGTSAILSSTGWNSCSQKPPLIWLIPPISFVIIYFLNLTKTYFVGCCWCVIGLPYDTYPYYHTIWNFLHHCLKNWMEFTSHGKRRSIMKLFIALLVKYPPNWRHTSHSSYSMWFLSYATCKAWTRVFIFVCKLLSSQLFPLFFVFLFNLSQSSILSICNSFSSYGSRLQISYSLICYSLFVGYTAGPRPENIA